LEGEATVEGEITSAGVFSGFVAETTSTEGGSTVSRSRDVITGSVNEMSGAVEAFSLVS
jgi:hypothetical protein